MADIFDLTPEEQRLAQKVLETASDLWQGELSLDFWWDDILNHEVVTLENEDGPIESFPCHGWNQGLEDILIQFARQREGR